MPNRTCTLTADDPERGLAVLGYSVGIASQVFSCGESLERIVAYAFTCEIRTHPGSIPSLSLTAILKRCLQADIAFCGLHRDMPEKKMDLLELTSRFMAQARTRPSEIMRRSGFLDNMPDRLF
jgi:hypothetical protein